MSVLSIPIPRGEWSVSEQPSPMVIKEEKILSANEVSGYRKSMSPEDATQAEIDRNRIFMSHGLSGYSNSEFVYAISPIAISLRCG